MILLASDYDGTLKRNGIIDNKNIEVILDFQRKGNQFAMITGRSTAMIQSELKKYRVPFDYVICGNGARVEQIDMSDEMFNDVSDYQQIIQDRLRWFLFSIKAKN